jgi:TPR repeat protein
MKRTLLFVLALAVIPVGVDAQDTPLASCAEINIVSPLEDLRSCAEQGDADLQLMLGDMYALGEGVPQDYVLAYMWVNLAVAQGNEAAQNLKDRVEQRMTREQIAEAQRLSREWIEAHPGGN